MVMSKYRILKRAPQISCFAGWRLLRKIVDAHYYMKKKASDSQSGSPLRLQKPKSWAKGESRGLLSASQKAGTPSVVLLKDAESGPSFAPSSEASGTLPPACEGRRRPL